MKKIHLFSLFLIFIFLFCSCDDNVEQLKEGITPVINTGIANKVAGRGQIGAGTVHPPIECFEKAVVAYAKKLGFEA